MPQLFGSTRSIFDTMVQFFREDNWKFRQIEDKPILQMGFSGNNGSWMCFAQARDDQQRFAFYSIMETRLMSRSSARSPGPR